MGGHSKNTQDHDKFIKINDLNQSHLPQGYQTEKFLKDVKTMADLTVKVKLTGISKLRPDFHGPPFGGSFIFSKYRGFKNFRTVSSGFISHQYKAKQFEENCKCSICVESGKPQSQNWYFIVTTSSLNVYDFEEAKCCKFQPFFDDDDDDDDDDDSEGNLTYNMLYGIDYLPKRVAGYDKGEMCFVLSVTHDEELGKRLEHILEQKEINTNIEYEYSDDKERPVVLISHPHGWSKRVSIGTSNKYVYSVHSNVPRNQPIEFGFGFDCILPYKSMSSVPWLDLIEANRKDLKTVDGNERHDELHIQQVKPYINNIEWKVNLFLTVLDNVPKTKLAFIKKGNDESDYESDNKSDNESYNKSNNESDSEHGLTPHPEQLFKFKIPKEMMYTLPDTKRRQFYHRVSDNFFRFPPGTEFHLPNNEEIGFLQQCVFKSVAANHASPKGFPVYNVASCPGSAGGCVMMPGLNDECSVFTHAGSLPDHTKIGLSSSNIEKNQMVVWW